MSNVLNHEKKQEVLALGRLGWSLRRIEQATGVRRETIGTYLKAAGIEVRLPGGRLAKPATEVTTDPGGQVAGEISVKPEPAPGHSPSASVCERIQALICSR